MSELKTKTQLRNERRARVTAEERAVRRVEMEARARQNRARKMDMQHSPHLVPTGAVSWAARFRSNEVKALQFWIASPAHPKRRETAK